MLGIKFDSCVYITSIIWKSRNLNPKVLTYLHFQLIPTNVFFVMKFHHLVTKKGNYDLCKGFVFEETNVPKLPFFKENKIEIAIFRPQVLAFGLVSSIAPVLCITSLFNRSSEYIHSGLGIFSSHSLTMNFYFNTIHPAEAPG